MSTNILKGVSMKTYTSLFEGNNPPLWYGELIQGDGAPPPGMKGHGDPFALWLQVEERLGRGVLPRQIKLSIMTPALEGVDSGWVQNSTLSAPLTDFSICIRL